MVDPGPILDGNVPIAVLDPFRVVNRALLDLLRTFSKEEWHAPTVHADRSVKDLVAHLIHGSLRRVTALRDRYHAPAPRLSSHEELTAFIQADNRAFMEGMKRISPEVLTELAERYDIQLPLLLEALEPKADGLGVVWAGEWTSKNWFDVAREYTEKWHHQQQLRDATGRPPLYEPALLVPVLETFARGFPYAYRALDYPEATALVIRIAGPVSLCWVVRREALDGSSDAARTEREAMPPSQSRPTPRGGSGRKACPLPPLRRGAKSMGTPDSPLLSSASWLSWRNHPGHRCCPHHRSSRCVHCPN